MDLDFVVDQNIININEAILFESATPGLIYQGVYYKFPNHIKNYGQGSHLFLQV